MYQTYSEKFFNRLTSPLSFVAIIAFGSLIRIRLFLQDHSLWLDEAWVAISITSRSLSEIFTYQEILPQFAKHPLFFLLIEKVSVILLGNFEYALRLFPLIAGVFSIILFSLLLNKLFIRKITVFTTLLFCLLSPAIYYCVEVKPYSSDLFMVLILFLYFEKIIDNKFSSSSLIMLGLIGAGIIWVSNVCIFVLAGFGITVFSVICLKKNNPNLFALMFVFFLLFL